MSRALLALLSLFFSAEISLARDIFVNNLSGDDIRDGSSPEVSGRMGGPCRSITRALKLAAPGDRIVLARTGEPYRESFTLQAGSHSGIPQQPFQIIGNGAILDGTRPVPENAWEHVMDDVYRFRPPRTSYQMLYLGDKPAARQIPQPGQGLPELAPLEWCLYDRQLYFRAEPGKSPRQYPLAYAHLTVAITLYEVRHIAIHDLVVQGFQLDGINAHDNVFDATIRGVIARGNGRSGISAGGSSRVTLVTCLAGDNGAAQVRTEGFCKVEIVNCELLANTAPALVREGGQVALSDTPLPK